MIFYGAVVIRYVDLIRSIYVSYEIVRGRLASVAEIKTDLIRMASSVIFHVRCLN
jgi:hypothetical protein